MGLKRYLVHSLMSRKRLKTLIWHQMIRILSMDLYPRTPRLRIRNQIFESSQILQLHVALEEWANCRSIGSQKWELCSSSTCFCAREGERERLRVKLTSSTLMPLLFGVVRGVHVNGLPFCDIISLGDVRFHFNRRVTLRSLGCSSCTAVYGLAWGADVSFIIWNSGNSRGLYLLREVFAARSVSLTGRFAGGSMYIICTLFSTLISPLWSDSR